MAEEQEEGMVLDSLESSIPTLLNEFKASSESMLQIATYCRQAYDTGQGSYDQTKQYINDAALNISYHAHKFSSYFTSYLVLQQEEVENLSTAIGALQSLAKASSTRISDSQISVPIPSVSQKKETSAKIEPKLPAIAPRRSVLADFSSLDSVGVSLSEEPIPAQPLVTNPAPPAPAERARSSTSTNPGMPRDNPPPISGAPPSLPPPSFPPPQF